jgi:ribosome-associated protein
MDDPMPLRAGVALPLTEIDLRTSRSSGPGGQHANVTASRVEASFDVEASGALGEDQKRRIVDRLGPRPTAIAQDSRSQARNRETALERLQERLARALEVQEPRRPTRPSRGARERRLEAKRRTGERKAARRRLPGDEG